ncbi:glycosyltransferase family 39 protein [Chryseolinea sp. H1M3-3]|uniref:glycosyltransferase family 39 protein n=1 Tax=Chryseolinea sp. H1M3-3 TaxID=3034144 RepID=UPI0023EE1C9B|nr:glycosyltransferase family 39 protein [Chryseolinea sp. H1M3-3]
MKAIRILPLIAFVLIKFLLQIFLISPEYDLQRDEYLHLDQAHHPAWGYLSVPPVTSWISYLIMLLGNAVIWVKFFPALFGALTIVVVWKTIEELDGTIWAQILGATCILLSSLLRLNTLYQPNSLDVLCWTALYFAIIKYISTEKSKWLYFGSIVFAIGFLNKYNIAFLVIGLLPAILLTEHRNILTRKEFYLALALALLLILPNLIWQYQNHFPVIYHMKELAGRHLVHVERSGFLKTQLLFFTGSWFVIIAGLAALLMVKKFRPYRLFFWSFFFTLTVFVYFKAKPYYAIGLYPLYIAFGSAAMTNALNVRWQKIALPILVFMPVLFFIPMWKYAFPNKGPVEIAKDAEQYRRLGLLRWEDGKDHAIPQDYADMLGWKELAKKVDEAYIRIGDPQKTLVLCDNYGQAGAINYYTTKGIRAVSTEAIIYTGLILTRLTRISFA